MFRKESVFFDPQYMVPRFDLACKRHFSDLSLVDKQTGSRGILRILHGQPAIDGRKGEVEVDFLAFVDLDILDTELETIRFRTDDILTGVQRNHISFIDIIVADLLVDIEALQLARLQVDGDAADIQFGD